MARLENRNKQKQAEVIILSGDEAREYRILRAEYRILRALVDRLPPDRFQLERTILNWAGNILVKPQLDWQRYLKSSSSLHQIKGAAGLMHAKIEESFSEGRNLTEREVEEIRQAFRKAAEARRDDDAYYSARNYEELSMIADNIETVIDIARRLKLEEEQGLKNR